MGYQGWAARPSAPRTGLSGKSPRAGSHPHFLLESAAAHARSAQSGQRRMRARTRPSPVPLGRRSCPRRAVTSPVADARGAGPPNATASCSRPRRRWRHWPRRAGGGASGASASRTAPSLTALSSGPDTWWRHQASTHGEGAGRAGGASAGSELRGEGGERRRTEGDRGGAGRWRPEHGGTDPSVPGAQRGGRGQLQTCGLLQRGGARAGGRAVQQVTTVPPHRSAQAPSPPGPVGSAQGGRLRSPAGAPDPGRASTVREVPGRCHDPGVPRRRAERRGGRASGSGGCSLK